MDHKRDIKTLVGFVVVCITLGVAIGSAKTHIYGAIKGYKAFETATELDIKQIKERLNDIESSPSHKDKQIAHMSERLAKLQQIRSER